MVEEVEAVMAMDRTELAWLVEHMKDAFGGPLWVKLAEGKWPRLATLPIHRGRRALTLEYQSPIEFVEDASEAIRFARKEDAEAFIKLFSRFLLNVVATEHMFVNAPARQALGQTNAK